jgi:hypothetical protein
MTQIDARVYGELIDRVKPDAVYLTTPSHNEWLSGLPCVDEIVTASFRGVLAAYDMSRVRRFSPNGRLRRCRLVLSTKWPSTGCVLSFSKVGRKAGRMARLIAGPVEPLSLPTRSSLRGASSARAQEAHHVHRHAGPLQACGLWSVTGSIPFLPWHRDCYVTAPISRFDCGYLGKILRSNTGEVVTYEEGEIARTRHKKRSSECSTNQSSQRNAGPCTSEHRLCLPTSGASVAPRPTGYPLRRLSVFDRKWGDGMVPKSWFPSQWGPPCGRT